MTQLRYFFWLPDVAHPTGGVSVAYQFVRILRRAGHQAFVLHNSPRYRYRYADAEGVPVSYTYSVRAAVRRADTWKRSLLDLAGHGRDLLTGGPNPRADLGPDDILVLPEWLLGRVPEAFSGHRRVLFTQNPFILLQGLGAVSGTGSDVLGGFSAHLSISAICDAALEQLGATSRHLVPLGIDTGLFRPGTAKSPVLAYMPRKRPQEAQAVMAVLAARGVLDGLTVRAIDGLKPPQVAEVLHDALYFISFSEQEGFGLPPAEAMASGCIVIGYHGIGGSEFFDETTGIPVEEGNTVRLLAAIGDTIAEYRQNPERLDNLRANAAATVARRYSPAQTEAALLAAWEVLDKQFT